MTAPHKKTIHVRYFAQLKEASGRAEETVTTSAATARALYEELRARYRFRLLPDAFRVAINTEFRDWDAPLSKGDTVVFLPPVAGG